MVPNSHLLASKRVSAISSPRSVRSPRGTQPEKLTATSERNSIEDRDGSIHRDNLLISRSLRWVMAYLLEAKPTPIVACLCNKRTGQLTIFFPTSFEC